MKNIDKLRSYRERQQEKTKKERSETDKKVTNILKKGQSTGLCFFEVLRAFDKDTYQALAVSRGRVIRSLMRLVEDEAVSKEDLGTKVIYRLTRRTSAQS